MLWNKHVNRPGHWHTFFYQPTHSTFRQAVLIQSLFMFCDAIANSKPPPTVANRAIFNREIRVDIHLTLHCIHTVPQMFGVMIAVGVKLLFNFLKFCCAGGEQKSEEQGR